MRQYWIVYSWNIDGSTGRIDVLAENPQEAKDWFNKRYGRIATIEKVRAGKEF